MPSEIKRENLGYLPPMPPEFQNSDEFQRRYEYPEGQGGIGPKMRKKMKENPLVPIGLGVTVFALTYGIYQLKTGNSRRSQQMMRLRVGAQGFTVLALLGGMLYHGNKDRFQAKGYSTVEQG